jgi:hypothetical protein
MLTGFSRSSIMELKLSNETVDNLVVDVLKDGLDTVSRGFFLHPEDIAHNIKLKGAFITLLEYYMAHSDFLDFIKEQYDGSDTNS